MTVFATERAAAYPTFSLVSTSIESRRRALPILRSYLIALYSAGFNLTGASGCSSAAPGRQHLNVTGPELAAEKEDTRTTHGPKNQLKPCNLDLIHRRYLSYHLTGK